MNTGDLELELRRNKDSILNQIKYLTYENKAQIINNSIVWSILIVNAYIIRKIKIQTISKPSNSVPSTTNTNNQNQYTDMLYRSRQSCLRLQKQSTIRKTKNPNPIKTKNNDLTKILTLYNDSDVKLTGSTRGSIRLLAHYKTDS